MQAKQPRLLSVVISLTSPLLCFSGRHHRPLVQPGSFLRSLVVPFCCPASVLLMSAECAKARRRAGYQPPFYHPAGWHILGLQCVRGTCSLVYQRRQLSFVHNARFPFESVFMPLAFSVPCCCKSFLVLFTVA